jgi:hypothetical protein
MINGIDQPPTPETDRNYRLIEVFNNSRNGKDRRKIHTMLDPDKDRRKGDRRKKGLYK